MCLLVGETLGQAVVDTGCPFTVTGETWLKSYINSLSRKDRNAIRTRNSNNKFRFGDGLLHPSKFHVTIPIYVGEHKYQLGVDVVESNIPLLLSRETLKRAEAKIDIGRASICFLGNTLPLIISSTGHMCLVISRPLDNFHKETQNVLSRVLFTSPMSGVGMDLKNKATKLHMQFCHPPSDRLIDLIKKSGTNDDRIFDAIRNVTSQCDVCIRNRRAPLRPAVGLPLATQFNETVALDLKSRGSDGYILHMVDHLTRYSAACLIKNKKRETIIKGIMDHWIIVFGSPKYFLTDNGGEFVNADFIDFAEKFNISLRTTAAESAWSNGLCERHNGILNNNVNKVLENGICSLDVAIAWAVAAKNSLANVYGFSPNMLVFGRNPNFPTAFINAPPANNSICLDKYVSENLNAMHIARKSFIEQESSERLRRALNRKSRTYSNTTYCQGDQVYYWRNNQSDCHGPAVVIGKDGQQCLLKHGGTYIRVHPCRMQLCKERSYSIPICDEQPCFDDARDVLNPKNTHVSMSEEEDDAYTTADEGNDENEEQPNVSGDVIDGVDQASNSVEAPRSIDWKLVANKGDLPSVGSVVECKFPNHQWNIKCTILSRAGKTSTANWHYLNIKEDDGQGKCCSFKNAQWKHVTEMHNENQPTSQQDKESTSQQDREPTSQQDREPTSQQDRESTSHEVFYSSDDSAFDEAKQQELDKWKQFKTFDEVPDKGEKTISTRWVCTRKIKGGKVVYKARLVARGFEEDSKSLRTDSPTCSKESLRITLAIISSCSWKLHSLDVRSAFLQGTTMKRNVFIKPPQEAKTKFIWKMIKCPYGLADAGRLWYLKLKKELIESGMVICKYDQALFTWCCGNKISGLLAVHVDDIIFGGEEQFHRKIIDRLRSTFSIGLEEDTNLKYLGLRICQSRNGIAVSTDDYAKSLKTLALPTNVSTSGDGFTSDETKRLKQFCGQINWISTQGRPDIAFESCYVSNSLKTGDRKMFDYANKIIRKTNNQSVHLYYPRNFDIDSCYIITFCDASFSNLLNGGSQGGYISFLVDKNGIYSPIAWQSKRIRRVVKSTIAAECLAAVEAAETTIFIASMLKDILKLSKNIDTFLFCDNRNLVNAVHSTTNLEDKRLRIDVSILRDFIEQRELTEFLWVATDLQLADVFTKQGASCKLLLSVLNNSVFRFHKSSASFE